MLLKVPYFFFLMNVNSLSKISIGNLRKDKVKNKQESYSSKMVGVRMRENKISNSPISYHI